MCSSYKSRKRFFWLHCIYILKSWKIQLIYVLEVYKRESLLKKINVFFIISVRLKGFGITGLSDCVENNLVCGFKKKIIESKTTIRVSTLSQRINKEN